MRGDAFAKECRGQCPEMPIILATGMDKHELRSMFEADPQVEVVEKPHHFSAVHLALERLGVRLARRRMRRLISPIEASKFARLHAF